MAAPWFPMEPVTARIVVIRRGLSDPTGGRLVRQQLLQSRPVFPTIAVVLQVLSLVLYSGVLALRVQAGLVRDDVH